MESSLGTRLNLAISLQGSSYLLTITVGLPCSVATIMKLFGHFGISENEDANMRLCAYNDIYTFVDFFYPFGHAALVGNASDLPATPGYRKSFPYSGFHLCSTKNRAGQSYHTEVFCVTQTHIATCTHAYIKTVNRFPTQIRSTHTTLNITAQTCT